MSHIKIFIINLWLKSFNICFQKQQDDNSFQVMLQNFGSLLCYTKSDQDQGLQTALQTVTYYLGSGFWCNSINEYYVSKF